MDEDYLHGPGKAWTTKDMPTDIIVNETIQEIVDSISSILTSSSPKSILITGDKGVGKSTLIQLVSKGLKVQGWSIFSATAGDIMAGQRYIGDLEQNIQNFLSQLTSRKNNLWIVPRFQELYYGGRHEYSPVSILDQVLPFADTGELKIMGEIDSNSLEKVIQYRPQVLSSFEITRVSAADREFTLELAADWIKADTDQALWKDFSKDDLDEVYHLAAHYLRYMENPGCLVDLLKQTKKLFQSKGEISKSILLPNVIDSLANITGMPKGILDDREKLDLEHLRKHFSDKVIGQEEAINVMIERIAMIKAGLTDPSKPAGVFLFVGPTGTGKTEIAKAMAEYLFGSADKLIRQDMSEFQTAESTYKILGDTSDVAENSALVNTIRKKPFSIVLLDEFEKAHPNVWDLFLQVFDDGRLTDQRGSVADFRHSIIVLTSNLGAGLPANSRIGFNSPGDDINSNVLKSIHQTFRPEFVNRIDRIVVFNPLTKSIAKKILKNELKKILQRRGLRRKAWELDFEDSALEFLLDKGFSKTLGARPLKRSIEKYLLAPLALTIVNHDFPRGNQFLLVSPGKEKLKVDFIDPDEPQYSWDQKKQILENQEIKSGKLDLKDIISDANGLLSEFRVIQKALETLKRQIDENDLGGQKSELMIQMSDPGFWPGPGRFEVLSEVEFLDRFESALESAEKLFERLDSPGKERLSYDAKLLARLAQRIFLLKIALKAYLDGQPQDAILQITYTASDEPFGRRIEKMYVSWSKARGMKMEKVHETNDGEDHSMVFSVLGFGAYSLLIKENGYHVLEFTVDNTSKIKKSKVKVSVIPMELPDYRSIDVLSFEKRVSALPNATNVRKFKEGKSSFVKDLGSHWQSGKVNYVLEGNFDLF